MSSTTIASRTIRPLGDRVLLRRIEAEEVTRGGIIIPDSAKEKPLEAEVLALGTGGRDNDGQPIPFQIKVGDRVLLPKYGGTEVKLDDETYVLARQNDLLGILG